MPDLLKQVLSITFIFCFVGEIGAQQGGNYGDSFPFSMLPNREFKLDYNPKMLPGSNPGLMIPNILMREDMLSGSPLQFALPSYESWRSPMYHELNVARGMLDGTIISYPVLNKSAFYLSGTQDYMPGISSVNSMTAGFMIQPMDNWIIDISGSAFTYRDFIGIHNDFTINASTHIFLSDNLGINLFGGYAMNAMRNVVGGIDAKSPFAPTSYFGGSLEYQFTDKFGLEGGVRREFNPWLRRWENVYFLVPKINLGLFFRRSEKQRERTDRLVRAYTK